MIHDEADEVIKELFKSLKNRYKIVWNQWKVVSLFSIMFVYCFINVIKNQSCGGSYIDSPDWMKNKKATITLLIKEIRNAFHML